MEVNYLMNIIYIHIYKKKISIIRRNIYLILLNIFKINILMHYYYNIQMLHNLKNMYMIYINNIKEIISCNIK
jgi:hypothetical protein